MFKPKTFDEICRAMQTRAMVHIDAWCGLVNGIESEDGSGRSWNVKIQPTFPNDCPVGNPVTVCFRE